MINAKVAIIGGTGFYHPRIMDDVREKTINTEFGETDLLTGTVSKIPVVFLARHGRRHGVPPHRVNYKANISALKELGVTRVLATTAVGSLRDNLPQGSLVIIDQFIDFTKNREDTFYNGENEDGVVHTDFTEPYCPQLRNYLNDVMSEKEINFTNGGTYICTEGPRYETPAEIKAFALWGADVVGMTGVPEVTLAREAGLCYSNLSLVTNFAAGISPHFLTHKEVVEIMREKISVIREIFSAVIVTLTEERDCRCSHKEDYSLG
jgi:5'-methylthioadenosine phosphorylase